jgi:hypothetical protein
MAKVRTLGVCVKCDVPAKAKGLCTHHYQEYYRKTDKALRQKREEQERALLPTPFEAELLFSSKKTVTRRCRECHKVLSKDRYFECYSCNPGGKDCYGLYC